MPATVHFIYCDINSGFYPGAHHGLAALFGSLRRAGYDYRLTHLTEDTDEAGFLDLLGNLDANAYAFSAMTNQVKYVRKFAPVLAHATEAPVLVGGVHAMLEPSSVSAVEGVTCAFACEADESLPAWLNAHLVGRDWRDTSGICWIERGQVKFTPPKAILNLDDLPWPVYDGFDMAKIIRDLGGRLSVTLSRGCPYDCAFCCNEALRRGFGEPGYARRRSPQQAVEMVKSLVNSFKPDSVRFEDDLLLVSKRWRAEFLGLYRQQVCLPMECNCRADLVDADLVKLLKESGCVSLDIGVESGDEGLRNDVLGKGISDEQLIRAFDMLNASGLHTYAYNIIALPGETSQMAWKTYHLNRRLRPSAGAVFYFYPYPHTALAQRASREGLLRDDVEDADSYTQRPSVKPMHMSYRQMRRIYRRLRMYLLIRRFQTFFPLPVPVKKVMAVVAWWIFRFCPQVIEILLCDSGIKRWLRRQAFRVNNRANAAQQAKDPQ